MTSHRVFLPEEIVARVAADGRLERYRDRSLGPQSCWPWQGRITRKGYGEIRIGARSYLAHRVAYAVDVAGPEFLSDRAAMVLHSCDNPPCCNPSHLRIGSHAENMRDAYERGRLALPVGRKFAGERLGAKLVEADVVAIRRNVEGLSQRAWARRLGVSQTQVSRAFRGVTFPEVNERAASHRSTPC